jgi:hypothetical protein
MTEDAQGYVTIKGRRYPSAYTPGAHWALDEAWNIVDTLPEGVLSNEQRVWLAGVITGALLKRSRL